MFTLFLFPFSPKVRIFTRRTLYLAPSPLSISICGCAAHPTATVLPFLHPSTGESPSTPPSPFTPPSPSSVGSPSINSPSGPPSRLRRRQFATADCIYNLHSGLPVAPQSSLTLLSRLRPPAMDAESVEGYIPPPEFVEDDNEPLIDLNLTDSTELWLLKLPFANDLLSDIDGQELSLKLHNDGQLASFEGSCGKVYDFVSFASEEPDETVFVSSATEPKIAGKISRRVSIIHYPDPKELEKVNSTKTRQTYHKSAGNTVTTSRYFPMQSGNLQSSQSGRAASSKGSRHQSSLSEVGEPSNTPKRRRVSESHEFSHGHSTGLSSVSAERSPGGKSKRKFKHKE